MSNVMYRTRAGSRDVNLLADRSTSNTTSSVYQWVCRSRQISVFNTSTRLLASLLGLAIRLLLLISGDVEANPGPLGQGEDTTFTHALPDLFSVTVKDLRLGLDML